MTVHNVIIIIQMDLRIIDFVHILNYVSLHQPYFSFFLCVCRAWSFLSRNRIWCILALKSDIWLQQF